MLSPSGQIIQGSTVCFSMTRRIFTENSFNNGPYFYSYSVNNATSLTHDTTLPMNCSATMSIFQIAQTVEPYAVYGNSWAGDASCSVVMGVDENGALSEVIQNYTYSSNSEIHGMAFSPEDTYLYSPDYKANTIWTHKIDAVTGELTVVQEIDAPVEDSEPRHISVHPTGNYAYVVTEAGNTLDQYLIDQTTHELSFDVSFSLFAAGANASLYKASDVATSSSGSYVFATTRGSATGTNPGALSGYKIAANGSIEEQIFVLNTSTAMGFAGSLTPSPDTDRWFALTDTIDREVEMYEFDGTTATVVASLELNDGGCCSNVVWYS